MKPASKAVVFPGQGSQHKGMGRDLFERYPDLCAQADEILGESLRRLCLENPQGRLNRTEITQPALFAVNAFAWLEYRRGAPPPDFLAGHSLGEYNALFAAGCFDFATGFRLVQQRGRLMSQAPDGGMAAVLGLAPERVRAVLDDEGAAVDLANVNLPDQLVLAGPRDQLEALAATFERAGARRYLLLNVSGAFHSRYMKDSAADYARYLEDFDFEPPRIPVVANTTARPYGAGELARRLAEQIHSPVRWAETLDFLRSQGVNELEELGPGKVLTKLWAAGQPKPAEIPNASKEGPVPRRAAPLGAESFRRAYDLRLACTAGTPLPGLRGENFVISLAEAGILAFLDPPEDEVGCLARLGRRLGPGRFGLSFSPANEAHRLAAALAEGVRHGEAVGYRRATAALLRFRFQGPEPRRLLVHVASPTAAKHFLNPPPAELVADLMARGELTPAEGEAARRFPLASDLCIDPAATSEGGDLIHLLPSLHRLRDRLATEHGYAEPVHLGAGGLGTPEAVAAAFLLGADFVATGAINLCSRESPLPPAVMERLAALEPGDTTSAPTAEDFHLGGRRRVVRKGTLFAPRAERLYELFRFYDSLEAIPTAERTRLERTTFERPLEEIAAELPPVLDPKTRLARIFRTYLEDTLRWTLEGRDDQRLNHQIPCDESLAAFNLYAAGTDLANPQNRGVAAMAELLLAEAAEAPRSGRGL